MADSGAQELLLPVVMPAELWHETGRWAVYGKELLRFRDRHGRDFCIGPTHEEAITDLLRNYVSSYRDLPKNCFQIQTKFRDEIRPRFGLMRGREFIMKDGYSFDRSEEDAHKTYDVMYDAYKRIFDRCGLKYRPVEATTGTIGGSRSHEFQVLAESGEDDIVSCNKCEYAANVDKAELKASGSKTEPGKAGKFKKTETPGQKSVEEVCKFLKQKPHDLVKTLIFETDQGPVAGLVRGDRVLKEAKLKDAIGCEWCNLAEENVVNEVTGASSGYAGPVGLSLPIYADYEVADMENFVVGANEDDTHLIDVSLADFEVKEFADIRRAEAGDPCPRCDGIYESHRGIEVGQVFYLGTKYSEPMKATYLDEKGDSQVIHMGCFGIGIGRTAAAAIEQNNDENGMIWPLPIAPFQVELIPLGLEDEVMDVAEKIYHELKGRGIEALMDDREDRPGVKFADADLIGIPYRIIIGRRGLADGVVELKERKGGDVQKLNPEDVVDRIVEIVSHVKRSC